jgi:hypothetical protein
MSSSLHHARTVAFSASMLLAFASGCHTTNVHTSAPTAPPHPVEHAPVVVKKYVYVHYPSCNVYCDHERNLWFWFEAGEWKFGAALPVRYHVVEHEAVMVELERDTPYEHGPAAPHPVVERGPAPHGNAYGLHRKFTYVHYPTYNVYCDRERKLWFWYDAGAWRSGVKLPAHYRVDEHEAVRVELEADTPFEHGNAHAHDNGKGHAKDHVGDARTAPHEFDEKKSNGNGRGNDKDDDSNPANDHGKSQGHGPSKNTKDGANASADSSPDAHGKGKSNGSSDDPVTKTNGGGDKSSNGKGKATANDGKDSSDQDKGSSHGKGPNNAKGPSNGDAKAADNQGPSTGDSKSSNGKGSSNGDAKPPSNGKDTGPDKNAGSNDAKDKSKGSDASNGSTSDDAKGSNDDASNGGKGKGKDKKDKGKPDNG